MALSRRGVCRRQCACERCGVLAEVLADTINAVTRAAHEEDWSVTFRRELELKASRLVYARR